MEKIKLGIVGIGNMGSGHAKNILQGLVPEIEISAVADRRECRRVWAKETFSKDVKIFTEGEDLIKAHVCDAVLIATPHYGHPQLVKLALENNLHVMSEKPAGVYTKEVREMNEVAKKHPELVFAMMFNQRKNPVYIRMHELISSGEFGAIKRVNWIITDWYRTQYYYDSGDWRATWNGEGGGVLLNQCPHNLDLLQWICGMPNKVQAFCHNGKWHNIEVEDDVTAYLEYPNGATGVFVTTTGDVPGTNRLEVTLEKGKFVCENKELKVFKLKTNEREHCFSAKEAFAMPEGEWIDANVQGENTQHVGVLNAFAGKILHGTPLVASGEEGINSLTLSNAMHLSSWLQKPVTLPLDEDLFLEELNKRRASSKQKEKVAEIVLDTKGSFGS